MAADGETAERSVTLKPGVWNKGAIIAALVRSLYSQDEMEAINNNRLLVLTSMTDAMKTDGIIGAIKVIKEQSEEAKAEYDAMQAWRATAKRWATDLLSQYPEVC